MVGVSVCTPNDRKFFPPHPCSGHKGVVREATNSSISYKCFSISTYRPLSFSPSLPTSETAMKKYQQRMINQKINKLEVFLLHSEGTVDIEMGMLYSWVKCTDKTYKRSYCNTTGRCKMILRRIWRLVWDLEMCIFMSRKEVVNPNRQIIILGPVAKHFQWRARAQIS